MFRPGSGVEGTVPSRPPLKSRLSLSTHMSPQGDSSKSTEATPTREDHDTPFSTASDHQMVQYTCNSRPPL